ERSLSLIAVLSSAAVRDDVPGPVLDLLVDLGDVVPQNAQADHQCAADEEQEQDDGGKALQGLPVDLLPQGPAAQHQRAQEYQHPQKGDDLQGGGGKGGQVGDGVPG